MESNLARVKHTAFHALKVIKKQQLTKNVFAIELEIPGNLTKNYLYKAGQYVSVKYVFDNREYINDYSITSAPFENKITLGIKINSEKSSANAVIDKKVGEFLKISEPQGRFVLNSKPHEFRTIVGFASGIGITPIFSHFKDILHNEPRTRMFLFYGNRTQNEVAFKQELNLLKEQYKNRLEIHYFFSGEKTGNSFTEGRLDDKKLNLIINQTLHLDDTDEESTIWDAVDEILICGKGEMIKSIANACYQHGIPKKNIHFELFEEYNEDIYPQEKEYPLIENIDVEFKIFNKAYSTKLENNKMKLLQQLLIQKFPVPYSCKSGICGSCECKLIEGEVELLENEYLTEKEKEKGHILACMSVILSRKIKINFDLS